MIRRVRRAIETLRGALARRPAEREPAPSFASLLARSIDESDPVAISVRAFEQAFKRPGVSLHRKGTS